jgi:uncharacterized membrane protein
VRNGLLVLHILSAMLLIGWLATHSMVVPGAIRRGPENAGFVRTACSFTAKIGPASGLVLLLGIALVLRSDSISFGDLWVWLAIVLYVVTAVIGAGLIGPAELRAADKLDAGQTAPNEARTISMLGGFSTLLLVVIVWLMVAKPGA